MDKHFSGHHNKTTEILEIRTIRRKQIYGDTEVVSCIQFHFARTESYTTDDVSNVGIPMSR